MGDQPCGVAGPPTSRRPTDQLSAGPLVAPDAPPWGTSRARGGWSPKPLVTDQLSAGPLVGDEVARRTGRGQERPVLHRWWHEPPH